MTKDKTNIEEIKSELHTVMENTESMVTLNEDGMTGWNFAEVRDKVALYIMKNYTPNDQVQTECEKYLDEFQKQWNSKHIAEQKYPESIRPTLGTHSVLIDDEYIKNFKKEQREHE